MGNSPPAPAPPRAGACACGQVVFDLSGRRAGEALSCSWCGKRYRFAGGDKLELLGGSAGPKPPLKVRSSARRADGPPGGLLPMIGFIVAFNALAIVALSYLLLKNAEDGSRHAVWDEGFSVAPHSIWPEAVALILGNALGFAAWAWYAYGVHKKELAARAANSGGKGA